MREGVQETMWILPTDLPAAWKGWKNHRHQIFVHKGVTRRLVAEVGGMTRAPGGGKKPGKFQEREFLSCKFEYITVYIFGTDGYDVGFGKRCAWRIL
jgi:hypothetical protein